MPKGKLKDTPSRTSVYAWRAMLRKRGLTEEHYNAILELQGGLCAICRTAPKKRRLAIDHDHKTGRVRGLLCYRCNYGLGFLREDKTVLIGMVAYLDLYREQVA